MCHPMLVYWRGNTTIRKHTHLASTRCGLFSLKACQPGYESVCHEHVIRQDPTEKNVDRPKDDFRFLPSSSGVNVLDR